MNKKRELKIILTAITIFFLIFLIAPIGKLLLQSFMADSSLSILNYTSIITTNEFRKAIVNSFTVSILSAVISTIIAFLLAYAVHYTNLGKTYKKLIQSVVVFPMLLPTITYGFAIIYSFGKQGLITRLVGKQIFDIYGFNGLLAGYIIYTLPISFMLISNTMGYIDKKFTIVSRLMGDSKLKNLSMTVLRPLWGTIAISVIQAFFLSFTDFGIPASVGGKFEVISAILYKYMLGTVPDFGKGAVVAVVMLLPSILSIVLLKKLEKYNIRYNKISEITVEKNKIRDTAFAVISGITMLGIAAMFAVIFILPFIKDWPYNIGFTLEHIRAVFSDEIIVRICRNSILVAFITALLGTIFAYISAIVTERNNLGSKMKQGIEIIALITNTIPGMVLGLAYLFSFSGTSIQGTFTIIIICNMVHFFSTPYLMLKNTLSKLNSSWETTAMLLGDSSIKTIIRIITPNVFSTLLEVFGYYVVNSIVTISAVVFIAGTKTMVITTKIKELQYFNKYNEVFVLSLLILVINLLSKYILRNLSEKNIKGKRTAKKIIRNKKEREILT